MLVWLTAELGRDPAVRLSEVDGVRLAQPRAIHDVALLTLGASADPLALLTIVRNTLKPSGWCLMVESAADFERLGDVDKLARAAGFASSSVVARGADSFIAIRLER